jgi:hypothetical protein
MHGVSGARAVRRGALVLAGLLLATLPAVPLRAAVDGTGNKVAGIVVATGRPGQAVANLDLARVRRVGFNTAAIAVFLDVDPLTQSSVRPGAATIPDVDLTATMQAARAQRLRPVVAVVLQCPGCPNPWRGALQPRDVRGFFASYRAAVSRYGALARAGGASLFVIGSEMNSLQRYADEWRRVAAAARAAFRGPVTYVANWDAVAGVGFWDALDVVGVSAYFPLSDEPRPWLAELMAAWHGSRMRNFAGRDWFGELAALAARTGKPVLFGEAGYRSATYTARWPFDGATMRPADPVSQANAYRALLATFQDQPWWAGVIWWEWTTAGGSLDTSFSPRDKAAEYFLSRWYAQGWRG